jgi:NADPH-dependent 2,4-dienoyl-CoA reductase/sulfur reductase-like enzyme/ferredoxin
MTDAAATPSRRAAETERPAFPNYLQMRTRVPLKVWLAARVVTLAAGVGLCVVLVVAPDTGLKVFWKVLVPLLPIVWFAMPGLWRNLCPLAASNQVPRVLKFTRALTVPRVVQRYSYVFAVVAFLLLVPARKVVFNASGPATAALLAAALGVAFVGGFFFKGKSGWCSSVCPLLPVQRMYGETPFLLVRNSHCEPCVGCAKNCFDFNPRVAKLADLRDDDPRYSGPRRFFPAAFPGLVLGFFSMPDSPQQSAAWVYGRIGLYVAASVAVFFALEIFTGGSTHRLTALFAAFGLNAFYWYSVPMLVDTLLSPSGDVRTAVIWLGRAAVLGLTIPWLVRTFAKERAYQEATEAVTIVAPAGMALLREVTAADATAASVRIEPEGPEIAVAAGTPLLDVIEDAGLPIEAGCRMGVCGADPVAVLAGGPSLSPVGRDEATTLSRLGYAENTRMACQARVHGACVVALEPEPAGVSAGGPPTPAVPFVHDPSVRRLVVIGNGVAGASAADHARRAHPECEIDVVGLEPHRFYNRIAISRLIYGRSAMQGLYLLPDTWYDDHGVTCWLNTRARSIDRDAREVELATGDRLAYDRLVIATGSRSFVPDIPGIGTHGSFTLRSADDAIAIRAFAQEHDVRRAVVAGGGLLGLESAYALFKLGIDTTVLERDRWLLRRQLDEPAARVLERYLEALGIVVVTNAATAAVTGNGRVAGVTVEDGRDFECGLFLACPGIVPNTHLAGAAGLDVGRGIVVDDGMRTSDPAVFAAGDVAEHEGRVVGLWPQSARQGEVAGLNAVGGDVVYEPSAPATMLKVAGIDVASVGRFEPGSATDVEVATLDEEDARYRKLLIADGAIAGAVLIGHPRLLPAVQAAIDDGRDVSGDLDALRRGDWSVLDAPVAVAT